MEESTETHFGCLSRHHGYRELRNFEATGQKLPSQTFKMADAHRASRAERGYVNPGRSFSTSAAGRREPSHAKPDLPRPGPRPG